MNIFGLGPPARGGLLRWSLVALALGTGCANLPDTIPPSCGNKVVDPGEDCDSSTSSVPAESKKTFACADSKSANACHFVTTDTAVCPQSMRTGSDGVCRKPGGGFALLGKGIEPTLAGISVSGRDPFVGDFNGDHKLDVALDDISLSSVHAAFVQYLDDGQPLTTFAFPKKGTIPMAVGDFLGRTDNDLSQQLHEPIPDSEYQSQLDMIVAEGSNIFVALQGDSDPGFTPIALSSNDPVANFRVVPISAAAFQATHEDLDVPALLLDCANTKNPLMSLCGLESGLPIAGVYGTGNPPIVLRSVDVWSAGKPPGVGTLVLSARAPADPTARCHDLMLAFQGTPLLRDVPVCGPVLCDKLACDKKCDLDVMKCPTNCTLGCRDAGVRPSFDIPLVGVPGCSSPTVERAFMIDANQDGIPDALVSARCMEGNGALLEFDGKGDGTYTAEQLVGTIKGAQATTGCTPGFPTLLAAGDIDQDGHLDFVFNDGIWLSNGASTLPSPLDSALTIPAPCSFSRAVVADVNRDGRPDVVVSAEGVAGLNVFISNGSSLPTDYFLSVPGGVQRFAVGDFDGDTVNDIAVTALPPNGQFCSLPSKLFVSWGRPSAFPEEPALIGQLPAVAQIVTEKLFYDPSAGVPNDGITDLGVLSECTPDEAMADPVAGKNTQAYIRHGAAVFNGATDRLLLSPYIVRLVDPATAIASLGLGAPYASGMPPEPEVLTLVTVGSALKLVPLPTTGGGVISALPPDFSPIMISNDSMTDITPAVAAVPLGGSTDVFVAFAEAGKVGLSQVQVDGSGQLKTLIPHGTIALSSMPSGGRVRVLPGDFDGDGKIDIAVLVEPPQSSLMTHGAMAIWYGANLDTPCEVPSPDMSGITGIASVDTGGNADAPTRSVALATSRDVLVYSSLATCSLGKGTSIINPRPDSPDVIGLASGDMDSDGLEDLVVLRPASPTQVTIEIFKQSPSFIGGSVSPTSDATSTSSATGG